MAIVLGVAKGMILKTNRTLLAKYGGHVILIKDRAKMLMLGMGFMKRKGTTSKSKNTFEHFHQLQQQFLDQVMMSGIMEEVPPELILNWDQTGLNEFPSSSWTMVEKGSKHVELMGMNDKRKITAVFCGSLLEDFIPIQLVYQGKMPRCHPHYQFLLDWHITHSAKHWSTEETM